MSFSIDSEQRNAYWNTFVLHTDEQDLLYHLAGADKKMTKEQLKEAYSLLLFYVYRFAIEKGLLTFFVRMYAKKNVRVLDCGGGTGRNAVVLSTLFHHVDCFDISSPMIEENIRRFSHIDNINFFVGSFDTIPQQIYDCIVVGGVFMCMSNEEITIALDTIYERLAPHGLLVVRDTLSHHESTQKNNVKMYRSEQEYLSLFSSKKFSCIHRTNSASRNIIVSIYMRCPKWIQKKMFRLCSFSIEKIISLDIWYAKKQPYKRHPMSAQVFHVFYKMS